MPQWAICGPSGPSTEKPTTETPTTDTPTTENPYNATTPATPAPPQTICTDEDLSAIDPHPARNLSLICSREGWQKEDCGNYSIVKMANDSRFVFFTIPPAVDLVFNKAAKS